MPFTALFMTQVLPFQEREQRGCWNLSLRGRRGRSSINRWSGSGQARCPLRNGVKLSPGVLSLLALPSYAWQALRKKCGKSWDLFSYALTLLPGREQRADPCAQEWVSRVGCGDRHAPSELFTCLQSSAAQWDRMRNECRNCPLVWVVD